MDIEELKKEIDNIKQRNKRVELDKKWETSWTRRICICILTYIVVIAYSYMVRNYENLFFEIKKEEKSNSNMMSART